MAVTVENQGGGAGTVAALGRHAVAVTVEGGDGGAGTVAAPGRHAVAVTVENQGGGAVAAAGAERHGPGVARVVWASVLMGLGAWQLAATWAGPPVIIAAAVTPLILIALAARRMPIHLAAAAVIILGAIGFYVVCVRSGLAVGEVLRSGVLRLLAAPRPAPATPELLLPGAVFAFLVGAWVGQRRAGPVSAPAGAVALYAAGALLSAGISDPDGYVAAAIAAVAALGWTVRLRGLIPAAALAAAVAVVVGQTAFRDPFDPRRHAEPESRVVQEANPLPKVAVWQQMGSTELLRFTGGAQRLRLVALGRYTGAGWAASATYRRIGSAADPRIRAEQIGVTITSLDGPWLPSQGRPLAVSLAGVEADFDADTLALREGTLTPGLSYRVTSAVEVASPQLVAAAGVPGESEFRDLPKAPPSFAAFAETVTAGAGTAFEKAAAIEHAVREGRRHNLSAPSGSSYARLETFLFRPAGQPGAQEGSAEQFAAAFAVIARAAGLPTRIVVGFAPREPGVVRGFDALAWPEVHFTGVGWYPFDPTPSTVSAPRPDAELKRQVIGKLAQPSARPSVSLPPLPSRSAQPVAEALDAPSPWQSGYALPATIVLIGLALLAARRVRTARHRRLGAPGAWAELLDLMVLMGQRPSRTMPAPQLAAALAARAPAAVDPAMLIAAAADHAAFAPDAAAGRTLSDGPGPGPGFDGPGPGPGAGLDGPSPGAGLDGPGPGAGLDGPGPGAGLDGPSLGAGFDGPGPGAGLDGPSLGSGPGGGLDGSPTVDLMAVPAGDRVAAGPAAAGPGAGGPASGFGGAGPGAGGLVSGFGGAGPGAGGLVSGFGGAAPAAAGPASAVWTAIQQARRAMRASVPWYRRLSWPFDPRPLWRRRHGRGRS